ncbi:hypothetical protein LSH36_683g03118 [Paralvinella palmiformis]|uniref:DDB1- and CUL4-associated factor 12 beta-propeller domain-containing protein n=1 Tax=Paralvinella palmiformis TaxID=53620 RepID=A0AAD9J3C6_9ANNE|nr:hypothetical protein LSH36_683g03118 [Paralvinella palmiformis]
MYDDNVSLTEEKTCVALNSGSRYMMGGGTDGLIHIWDLNTRKLKMTYKDHKSKVTSVQFNWNDSVIASGSESGKIILFSVITGIGYSPLFVPKAQAVRQVQYSHKKKSLLGSVSDDGAVNLWDTSSKKLLHSFVGSHKAPAMGLAFSPFNEMLLMSVGLDKRIICYDVVQKQPLRMMTAESPLTSIDVMLDGSTLAVGTTRGKVYIYDLRLGATPIKVLTAHKSSVQSLRFQNGVDSVQSDVGGIPRSSNSSQVHREEGVLNDTNAVNNNLMQRDIPNGTTVRSATGLDNQQQGSHNTSSDGCVYSPLKGNANLSRSGYNSSSVSSNGPSPMAPSRPSEVGFTEEQAKLYGMDDVTNSFCDMEVKSRTIPTAGVQPVVSSTNISHEHDEKLIPSGLSQFGHHESPQPKSSRFSTNYNSDSVLSCPGRDEAATITPPEAGPSSEVVAGAASSTLQPFQTQFIRNIVMDAMEEFRDQIRQDVLNLHTELIKQFFIQQMEIERLVKQHSINDELLAEIQRLREENKQLKKKY